MGDIFGRKVGDVIFLAVDGAPPRPFRVTDSDTEIRPGAEPGTLEKTITVRLLEVGDEAGQDRAAEAGRGEASVEADRRGAYPSGSGGRSGCTHRQPGGEAASAVGRHGIPLDELSVL